MIDWLTRLLQNISRLQPVRSRNLLHWVGTIVAIALFVLIATLLVVYDSVFLGFNNLSTLQIGDLSPQDIRAPISVSPFISKVLTEQRQQEIRQSVPEIYFPPNPAVSRQQSDMVSQILAYIQNIRHDPYGTAPQKIDDLRAINDLILPDSTIIQLLGFDEKAWTDITDQITGILERVMRGEIRDSNLQSVITQLPMQVGVRFSEDQADVIVQVVRGLIRPNTLLDTDSTEQARQSAVANIIVRRSFERGQVILRAGEKVDAAAYEALGILGLLEPTNQRVQEFARAALASIIVVVVTGLYLSRFKPELLRSSRVFMLLAALFLVTLLGARLSVIYGQIYLYPTAAMAILYAALASAEVSVIGVLGLATLVGLMQNNSLEMAMLVGIGGMLATLTVRHPERLNGYFMPGLVVGLANIAVVLIFFQGDLTSTSNTTGVGELIVYSLVNGVLSATVSLAGIYIATLLFNLPTGLKLVELSQPNQPLLQRLLREAPGTYQHSLQVSNMSEQAANAIGVNADLVRVAALYHDVGKMINPAFFTENQIEGINPHDALADPARSAAIIISHVTEGDKIARQYRLPPRLRDFILEHHGTQVLYFYQQAVQRAGSDQGIDVEQFTYPGPKPQTKETAILMLADSSEATVRSRKPTKKQEIDEIVHHIIDGKIQSGQLDESGLTLNDLNTIRRIFVDMLQAVFHPRINYPPQLKSKTDSSTEIPRTASLPNVTQETLAPTLLPDGERSAPVVVPTEPALPEPPRPTVQTKEIPAIKIVLDTEDEAPLPDVPPLPRTGEYKTVRSSENGKSPLKKDAPEEQ